MSDNAMRVLDEIDKRNRLVMRGPQHSFCGCPDCAAVREARETHRVSGPADMALLARVTRGMLERSSCPDWCRDDCAKCFGERELAGGVR